MVLGNPRGAPLTQPIDIGDRRALGMDRQNYRHHTVLCTAGMAWLHPTVGFGCAGGQPLVSILAAHDLDPQVGPLI